jgi:hypothetical protein
MLGFPAGGTIGGILGFVALFFYRLFTDPYLLGGGWFSIEIFLAAINGLLIGVIILSIFLLLARIGILLRVLVGTVFSFCSATIYLYLHGALLYSDFRAFISNSLLVGFFLGAPAGALAMSKLQTYKFSGPIS